MTETSDIDRGSWFRHSGRRVGSAALLVLLLIGFVSIVWTPYPIGEVVVPGDALQAPGATHWLGTDQSGRDIVSMLMKGMLTSFVVAGAGVLLGAVIGVPAGLAAAVIGGRAEAVGVAAGDFFLAVPALVVAVLLATVYGPGLAIAVVAIATFNIPVWVRAARDGDTRIRSRGFVVSARLAGMGRWTTLRRHVLPNIGPVLAGTAALQMANGVLTEAALSFVGLGVQPPATSLGLMLNDAQAYAALAPSVVLIPGLLIVVIALALRLAGTSLTTTSSGGSDAAA